MALVTIACVGHPGSLEREDSVCPTWGDLQPTVDRGPAGPETLGRNRSSRRARRGPGRGLPHALIPPSDRQVADHCPVPWTGLAAWPPRTQRRLQRAKPRRTGEGRLQPAGAERMHVASVSPGRPRAPLLASSVTPRVPSPSAATPVRWGEQLPPARTQGLTLAKCRPLLPFSGRRVFRAICHLEMALRPLPRRPQVSEQEENWGYMAPDLLIFPFQPENTPKVCKQLEVKGKGCPPPPLRKEAIREAAAEGTRPAGPRGGVSGLWAPFAAAPGVWPAGTACSRWPRAP